MNKVDKGFTLVELIVVITLMVIVIQLGYSMLMYGNTTFNLSTSRGLSQQNVRLAEKIIVDEFKYVEDVSLDPTYFHTKYYSLKYENNELVKSYHEFNDGTNSLDSTVIQKVAGSWDKLILNNSIAGEIDLSIGQAEQVGNKSSRFDLTNKIYTVNNAFLMSSINVDLTQKATDGSTQVIYYQQTFDYLSLMSNAISVDITDLTPVGGGSGTVLLKFYDDTTELAGLQKSAVVNEEVMLPDALTKAGSTFLNWNTEADGDGTAYNAGTIIHMPGVHTSLYAKWGMPGETPRIDLVKLVKIGNKVVSISSGDDTKQSILMQSNFSMEILVKGAYLQNLEVFINSIVQANVIFNSDKSEMTFQFNITTPNGNNKDFSINVELLEAGKLPVPYNFNFKTVNK